MTYQAPVEEIAFSLKHIAGLSDMMKDGLLGDLDEEVVDAILNEAGRFASERIAPLNAGGDVNPAKLVDGEVVMPDGWAGAYQDWANGGWCSLAGPTEFGGQGLPLSLSMACAEMWNAASMAFALNPLLTQGAAHTLYAFGSEQLKNTYLAKMVSGEWSGTMQLTEPQSGSDLSQLNTKAVPQPDGSYLISGTKIFITYGEHPMAENIVHMVLARTPDAPAGTKGISLFLVPKYFVGDDGVLGGRNDAACTKLEHKLGIHASPTCVMTLGDKGGSRGWLVGEENKGLAHMFMMMNEARLAVAIQGVGIASRAFSQALAYAQDRKQGRALGSTSPEMSPIIEHPDIRRMLMTMKASTSAARAIAHTVATAFDRSSHTTDTQTKAQAHALASLLTPVAKAYGTDVGVMAASEGVQVHGGMGYIEETGAAQHLRDARIAPIYEGTNGIQAIDLATRRLPMNGGSTVVNYIGELKKYAEQVGAINEENFGDMGASLTDAVVALEESTNTILRKLSSGDAEAVLAIATPYAKLFGLAAGGALLGKGALYAVRGDNIGTSGEARICEARFFAETLAKEANSLKNVVNNGAVAINSITPEILAS